MIKREKNCNNLRLSACYLRCSASTKGQILIEIIVATAIIIMVSVAIAQSVASSLRGAKTTTAKTTAVNLSQEMVEAVRAITLENWQNISTLATGSVNTFYTVVSAGKWATSTPSENVALNNITYNRLFWLDDVMRSSTGTIVTSGGIFDPSTKKMTTRVTWTAEIGTGQTFNQAIYLSRFSNETYEQTAWEGGPIGEVVVTIATTTFATSTNVNYASTTGSITIQEQ